MIAGCGGNGQPHAENSGGGSSGQASVVAGSGALVDANLVDYGIGLTASSVRAGRVTFVAANIAHDEHELVLIRTDRPADALSTTSGGIRASESGKVDEIDGDGPGGAKSLTLTLKPGHYALICNLPGHYHRGMHVDLTVV
jgi:uncharacterized cupredoxin-like copper-binding protein